MLRSLFTVKTMLKVKLAQRDRCHVFSKTITIYFFSGHFPLLLLLLSTGTQNTEMTSWKWQFFKQLPCKVKYTAKFIFVARSNGKPWFHVKSKSRKIIKFALCIMQSCKHGNKSTKMLLHFVILKCPFCVLTPCTFLPMTTSEKPHGIWRHYFYNTTTRSFSTFILETLPLIDPVWIFCILLNILPNIVWGNICKKLEILFHTQFHVKWVFVNWFNRKLSF